jgi:hypothetical protein
MNACAAAFLPNKLRAPPTVINVTISCAIGCSGGNSCSCVTLLHRPSRSCSCGVCTAFAAEWAAGGPTPAGLPPASRPPPSGPAPRLPPPYALATPATVTPAPLPASAPVLQPASVPAPPAWDFCAQCGIELHGQEFSDGPCCDNCCDDYDECGCQLDLDCQLVTDYLCGDYRSWHYCGMCGDEFGDIVEGAPCCVGCMVEAGYMDPGAGTSPCCSNYSSSECDSDCSSGYSSDN